MMKMTDRKPYIQFYPTMRCNYHCHFCFNKGIPTTDDVTLRDFEHSMPFYRFYETLASLKETYRGLTGVFCSGFVSEDENGFSFFGPSQGINALSGAPSFISAMVAVRQ